MPVGRRVEQAFARRLERLPMPSREALLLAAISDRDSPGELAAALRARGRSAAAFDRAEESGLVAITDGQVRFRHPLVRSVVYQCASGA